MDLEVLDASEVYPNPTASLSMFYSDPSTTPRRKVGEGTDEWGWLSSSISAIYGDNADDAIDSMFGGALEAGEGKMPANEGKVMHWKRIPGSFRVGPKNDDWKEGEPEDWRTKWHDEIVMGWKVVEVEGVGKLADTGAVEGTASSSNGAGAGASDLLGYVLDIANGKTAEAFYEVALDDPQVMKNPGLIAQLNSREFVKTMSDLQRLSVGPDGVLTRIS
jgi:hypothetical protein